jgi:hypothetical protein
MGLAASYLNSLQATGTARVAAEPEAQLTIPVHDLLVGLAAEHALGDLVLIREAQLLHVRPDFAALIGGRACGWVELKAPGHSLDGPKWVGREKRQWSGLSELDSLVVTNGMAATLYQYGESVTTATLPTSGTPWDPGDLVNLLRLFVAARPATVTRVSQLASQLAPLARMLRERILVGLAEATSRPTIVEARVAWQRSVHEGASQEQFADDLAQVVAYALAIAALRGTADADGYVSLEAAQRALRGPNEVLAAALSPILTIKGLMADIRPEVGAIERLVSAVDAHKVRASKDQRGEPWLWFYEDFLAKYDPKARKETGVYYTPTPVVEYQIRAVEHVLKARMGRELGFGNSDVVTLDPASGSGTYPLAVLDSAAVTAEQLRGPAGPQQVSQALARNIFAFEILAGPYAVSHLRIGQRLADMAGGNAPPSDVQVFLTDTLDDPYGGEAELGLWGDQLTLAHERERARAVKRDQPVTAIVGNPPYRRRDAKSGGGWVVHRSNGKPIFAELVEAASAAGVNFAATASLYNDYVYFWRWALWKAFEQRPDAPGIVSFITASSWLSGPGLLGLRRRAREFADEIWILDLGGDGHGAVADENVFAIQTPVSIVTLFRSGASREAPATVWYRRVGGTRAEKLEALASVGAPSEADPAWVVVSGDSGDTLVPATGDEAWAGMPLVTNLFPWQQPGCKYGRTWPIAPTAALLTQRWASLLEATESTERARRFASGAHGRDINTSVAGLPTLASLQPGTASRPIVRYAFRPFDLQWSIDDPRLARTESPSLWRSVSSKQVFICGPLTAQPGPGPVLVASAAVPDLHHFRGAGGGKDVIPLYRDAHATPNVTSGLLDKLSARYGIGLTVEDLAAYTYALLAHPGYQEKFETELQTPGIRVPLTASAILFKEAVSVGGYLLHLHTFGERFVAPARPAKAIPTVAGIGWAKAVTQLPVTEQQIQFDPAARTLHIGDGVLTGVTTAVWNYSVSGFGVVPSWLGTRTQTGSGRAARANTAKPLDLIRPSQWDDTWNSELLRLVRVLALTIETHPVQASLLERITTGAMISAADLPEPKAFERQPPKT